MWYRGPVQSSAAAISASSQYLYEVNLTAAAGNVVVTLPSSGPDPRYIGVTNASALANGSKVIIIRTAALVEVARISAAGETVWVGLNPATSAWEILAQGNPSEYQWTFANATERLAASVSAAQVGRTAYQSDLQAVYRLLSASPMRWGQLPYTDVAVWRPIFGNPGAAVNPLGVNGSITFGSQAGLNPTSTNAGTQLLRTNLVTAAGAGSIAVYRAAVTCAPLSITGMRYRFQITLAAVSASMRWGIALGANAIATNVDPASQLNLLAVGRGNAEANVQAYRSNAAGPATQADLGAAFPAATLDSAYDIEFFFPAGGATAVVQMLNLATLAEVSQSYSTNLPANNVALLWQFYCSNNADAVSVGLGVGNMLQGQIYR